MQGCVEGAGEEGSFGCASQHRDLDKRASAGRKTAGEPPGPPDPASKADASDVAAPSRGKLPVRAPGESGREGQCGGSGNHGRNRGGGGWGKRRPAGPPGGDGAKVGRDAGLGAGHWLPGAVKNLRHRTPGARCSGAAATGYCELAPRAVPAASAPGQDVAGRVTHEVRCLRVSKAPAGGKGAPPASAGDAAETAGAGQGPTQMASSGGIGRGRAGAKDKRMGPACNAP